MKRPTTYYIVWVQETWRGMDVMTYAVIKNGFGELYRAFDLDEAHEYRGNAAMYLW